MKDMKTYKDLLNKAESLIKGVSKETTCNNSDSGKILAAAVIGLAVGGILGILFAPTSGAEIRSNIADSVGDISGTIRDKAKLGYDKLADLKDQAVDSVRAKTGTAVSEAEATA